MSPRLKLKRKHGKPSAKAAYSHVHLYRPADLPRHAQIAAVEIEDPYGQAGRVIDGVLEVTSRQEQFQHRDGTIAAGAPGWTPPPRPTITVVQSLKNDPLGHMRARHQIDNACFLAGRKYQDCYVLIRMGQIKSVDLTGGSIDGARSSFGALTDTQLRAARVLARLDTALSLRYGGEALLLVRNVLGESIAIEEAARMRGSMSNREVRSWGWLFRKCLNELAVRLGYATR